MKLLLLTSATLLLVMVGVALNEHRLAKWRANASSAKRREWRSKTWWAKRFDK